MLIWLGIYTFKHEWLNDPKKVAQDVSGIGHWGNGDYKIQIENDKDLEYIMSIVKQAIQKLNVH